MKIKTKNLIEHLFISISTYLIVFITILCLAMVLIGNNLTSQEPELETLLQQEALHVYILSLWKIPMRVITVILIDGSFQLNTKNLPGLYYTPFVIALILSSIIWGFIYFLKLKPSKK